MRAAALLRLLGRSASATSALWSPQIADASAGRLFGPAVPVGAMSSSRGFAKGRGDDSGGDGDQGAGSRQRKGKLVSKKRREDPDKYWAKVAEKTAGVAAKAAAAPEKPPAAASAQKIAAEPPPPKVVDMPEGVTVRELARRLQARGPAPPRPPPSNLQPPPQPCDDAAPPRAAAQAPSAAFAGGSLAPF